MMAAEIITIEDLQRFRIQLLNDLKEYMQHLKKDVSTSNTRGYKTNQVRKILGCSNGKLQALRIAGKIRCNKVGGTLYYNQQDIDKLLSEGS